MRMQEVLADLIQSIAMDASSSTPGLFTLATIIRRLEFGPYNGKGKEGALTQAQIRAVKSWLQANCERKVINGEVYFKPRW